MIRLFIALYRRLAKAAVDSCVYAEPKMIGFGLLASIGFPLYYFIWTYLVPQSYENLELRLSLALLAAPLLATSYWPPWLRKFLPVYWYAVLILCLPFFFTFMLLQNGANIVWSMSTVTAILLVVMVIDTLNAFVIVIIGAFAAFLTYTLVGHESVPWADHLSLMPIYGFAMVTGALFNLANEREKRAKTVTARALGGHVAHELGNPLQTISFSAKQIKECAPALIDAYQAAKHAGLDITPIAENHLRFISDAGRITELEANYALMVIDMMLKKAGTRTVGTEEMRDFSIMQCVEAAVGRYAFKSPQERGWVKTAHGGDFTVRANEVLIMHVVFNLLKNGLYAVKAARRRNAGSIRIWAVPDAPNNRLHILDNGTGMAPQTVARVFEPFFTTRATGAGLGLHFCRDVMQRFGGEITCRSRTGEFTEFVLYFPPACKSRHLAAAVSEIGDETGMQELDPRRRGHPTWKGEPVPNASPGSSV